MVAAAAKRSGRLRASFIAPYPPIERPATNVRAGSWETRKNRPTISGSSSATKSQYRGPATMLA